MHHDCSAASQVPSRLCLLPEFAPAILLQVSLASVIITRNITVDTLVAIALTLEPSPLDSCAQMSIGCAFAFPVICALVDHFCTEIFPFRQTFRVEQEVLFQRGFLQSLQHDRDACPYCVSLRQKPPCEPTGLQRNRRSTNSTAFPRSGS